MKLCDKDYYEMIYSPESVLYTDFLEKKNFFLTNLGHGYRSLESLKWAQQHEKAFVNRGN